MRITYGRDMRVSIRQAAITAIHNGTEKITKATLDAVQLDHLAENHHRPHSPTRPRPR
ncbi:hypothetical protein GCM10010446_63600 [Streptomyces enissocaesilis]|uniref:Transposase n=1 Tax=Streptomyces enissocaesilis TaxID=332589 RepID=A0ABP6K7U5_9ACTN